MTEPMGGTARLDPESRRVAGHVLVTRGVIAILLGIVAVAWPDITVKAFAIVIGLFVAFIGALVVAGGFAAHRSGGAGIGGIIAGLVLLAGGLAAVFWPGPTVLVLARLFGAILLVSGVITAIEAFVVRHREPAWGFLLGWGVVSAGFGLVMWVWPDITIGVLVILQGILWILSGLFSVLAGRQVRTGALA